MRNPFDKSPCEVTRKLLAPAEFRKAIVFQSTGKKPSNLEAATDWVNNNPKYSDLEDKYNKLLADHITYLRKKLYAEYFDSKSKPHDTLRESTTWDRMKLSLRKQISVDEFDEFWARYLVLISHQKPYQLLLGLYRCEDDTNCYQTIIEYIATGQVALKKKFGCDIPNSCLSSQRMTDLIHIYEKHKERYGLERPTLSVSSISYSSD